MKKILIVSLVLVFIGMTRIVGAAPTVNQPAVASQPTATQPTIVTVMDEVPVPEEILVRIQSVYVGYAVTQATKGTKGSQAIYRLKIEHDNVSTDLKPVYLIYDTNWQFIEEEQWVPPAPVEVTPPAEPTPAPEPERHEDKPDEDKPKPQEQATQTQPQAPSPTDKPDKPDRHPRGDH